ncbi:MAG: LytR C-terminal domain-containing protein [Solirubrobacterales bacterium]|nr:LytR C-terminal domain-containing protein [Solirubrobacterales bacterium]
MAPAGLGAPALSAATRLIPTLQDNGLTSIRRPQAGRRPAPPAGHPAVGPTAVGRPGQGATGRGVAGSTAVTDHPTPPPSTRAGGANGSRVTPAPGFGAPAGRQQRLQLRPTSPAHASPRGSGQRPRGSAQPPRGSRVSRVALGLAAALLVVVVVIGLLVATSGGSKRAPDTAARPAQTTAGSHLSRTVLIKPSTVTVAVLNGTSTTNLAHDIMAKLSHVGYRQGAVLTAPDQTQTSTVVGYLPSYRREAEAVARSLKLRMSAVQAVDASNRAVACNGATTACSAQVVVTVGADLAGQA